jgi:hypothetical protein
MQASCATNTKRTDKKNPTRRAPSDVCWDWDPKILAQFTPRVERSRALSLSALQFTSVLVRKNWTKP